MVLAGVNVRTFAGCPTVSTAAGPTLTDNGFDAVPAAGRFLTGNEE
jgi:hypothetical protein